MTKVTKSALTTAINTDLASNTSGDITAADLRGVLHNATDSFAHEDEAFDREKWLLTYGFRIRATGQQATEGSVSLSPQLVREALFGYTWNAADDAVMYEFTFDATTADRTFTLEFDNADRTQSGVTAANWVAYPAFGANAYPIEVPAGADIARVLVLNPTEWYATSSAGTERYSAAVARQNGVAVAFTNLKSQMFHLEYVNLLYESEISLATGDVTLNSGDNATTTVTFTTPVNPATHPIVSFELNPSGYSSVIINMDLERYKPLPSTFAFPDDHLKLVWRNDDDPPHVSRMGEVTGGGGWHREARIAKVLLAGGYRGMIGGLHFQWLINAGSTTSLVVKRLVARSRRV